MSLLRIYSLRIFTSVVFLPFVAIAAIAILRKAIFPNAYFNDLPIVAGLWGILLLLANMALSKIGENRFQNLDRLGWNFLQANDSLMLSRVFANLEKLFTGGLLSRRQHLDLEKLVLRRYFSYYQGNIEDANFRAKLLKCLQLGIRGDEAFNVLKGYLLQQNMLTLELVDLAEMLHEYEPEDQTIIRFMAGQYLQDSQKHHRAEYFYLKVLETGSENIPEIIDLCLKRTLSHRRTDTFAGWLYYHAYQNNLSEAYPPLSELLYKTGLSYEATQRNDKLAANISAIVADFPEDMIAAWQTAEKERQEQQLSARIARVKYHIYQKMVFLWEEAKQQRKVVYYAGAAISFSVLIYFVWPTSQPEVDTRSKTVNPVIDDSNARFALQVGALKSEKNAQREVGRLRNAGLDAVMITPSGRSRYYRIQLGKFLTKNDALAEGETLRQKKVIRDFFVVNFVKKTR